MRPFFLGLHNKYLGVVWRWQVWVTNQPTVYYCPGFHCQFVKFLIAINHDCTHYLLWTQIVPTSRNPRRETHKPHPSPQYTAHTEVALQSHTPLQAYWKLVCESLLHVTNCPKWCWICCCLSQEFKLKHEPTFLGYLAHRLRPSAQHSILFTGALCSSHFEILSMSFQCTFFIIEYGN